MIEIIITAIVILLFIPLSMHVNRRWKFLAQSLGLPLVKSSWFSFNSEPNYKISGLYNNHKIDIFSAPTIGGVSGVIVKVDDEEIPLVKDLNFSSVLSTFSFPDLKQIIDQQIK